MRDNLKINHKILPVPSFFWISNLGGGSDKYRETVYLDLYDGIPTLYNYYYLKYADFAKKWLSQIGNYSTFSEFLKFVRQDMIATEKYISVKHNQKLYDYQNNIYLLDSGARNILHDIIRGKINTKQNIEQTMIEQMYDYYEFADRMKFDLVIGFDLGGKYTFKDSECSDIQLKLGLSSIDFDSLNFILLEKTVEYLKRHPNYFPKVYATIHGTTPDKYENYIKRVLDLEKNYNFEFFGYALGGVASSRNIDSSWLANSPNKSLKNPTVVREAMNIVKKYSRDKPIHVLGGGNKDNIPILYFSGATSFDCQTPGRRAYDGNDASTQLVFDINAEGSFSKYLPTLFSSDGILNSSVNFDYTEINKIHSVSLCDCPSCNSITSFMDIKTLYNRKNESREDYYYARQLINSHAIWQHKFLCEYLVNYRNFKKIIENNIEFFEKVKPLF